MQARSSCARKIQNSVKLRTDSLAVYACEMMARPARANVQQSVLLEICFFARTFEVGGALGQFEGVLRGLLAFVAERTAAMRPIQFEGRIAAFG